MDTAIAQDQALPEAQRPPVQWVKGLLDARVFDAAGTEVYAD